MAAISEPREACRFPAAANVQTQLVVLALVLPIAHVVVGPRNKVRGFKDNSREVAYFYQFSSGSRILTVYRKMHRERAACR